MSCSGCADRKRSLQAWLRRLIGAAPLITTEIQLGRLQAYVKVIQETQKNDITEMRRQHNVLDRATSEWLMKLEAASQDVTGRMATLRALNKDVKDKIRSTDSRLEVIAVETSELAETVGKIEFPEIRVPEYKINTKD